MKRWKGGDPGEVSGVGTSPGTTVFSLCIPNRRLTTSCPTLTMGRASALTAMIMATRQCTDPENGYPQDHAPPGCGEPREWGSSRRSGITLKVGTLTHSGHSRGPLVLPPGQWRSPHPRPT